MFLNHKVKSDEFIIKEDEIISFATNYDPMFFHLNKNEAQDSIFEELVASGLHSICIILQKLNEFVTLDQIKNTKDLLNMPLVKQSRLSVSPVSKAEWEIILKLGKTTI